MKVYIKKGIQLILNTTIPSPHKLEDQKQKIIHINNALIVRGYPKRSFKEVRKGMDNRKPNSKGRREDRSRRRKMMEKRLR